MYNSFNDWGFSDSSNFLITISQMISDSEGGVSTDDVVELINSSLADIEIDGQDLEYTLKVKGNNKGQIIIPKDNYLKDVQYKDGKLNFTFELADGAKTVDVDLSSLNDKKYVDETISVTNKNVATLNTNLVNSITKMNESIATINQNLVDSVNTINGGIADEIAARQDKESELEQSIEGKANAEDVYSKEEVDEKIASAVTEGKVDLSGYVTTEALTEGLAKKVDSDAYEIEKETFALKSDIPDVSPYETSEHAEETYQVKGDYATKEEIPVVPSKLSEFENDSEFITTSQVAEKYQPKGEYLTEHQDLSEYAKTADVDAKVAEVNENVEKKQDAIEDIATIREGAALGKTALQEVPEEYAKKEDIPTDFYSKAEIDATVQGLNDLINEGDESLQVSINKKQGILTAGDGISIDENNVISSTLDVTLYKVVDSLPTEDINDNKIYLMLSEDSAENNIYTEYIHVNDKWEIVGEYKAEVNLTPYLKSEDAAKLYATQETVNAMNEIVLSNQTSIFKNLETLTAQETTINELKETLSSDENSIFTNTAKIAELSTSVDEYRTILLLQGADVETIKGDITSIKSSIDGMKTAALETVANVTTLQEQVKTNTATISTQGEEIETKANKGDVEGNSNEILSMKATLESYKALLDQMRKDFNTYSSTDFVAYDGSATVSADGKIIKVGSDTLSQNTTITSSGVIFDGSTQESSIVQITANKVEANDLVISGDFPRSITSSDGKKKNQNSYHTILGAETVNYSNLTFTPNDGIYNGIEIDLRENTVAKDIIFENCDFNGNFKNNAINIFGLQDNATVTINNCHFKSVSNALRLSNRTNAKNVTVNFTNCTIDEWESRPNMVAYTGAIIFEDYNSTTTEEVDANKQFSTFTLNITNLVHNGEKILPTDLNAVLGTQDENQVMYVSADYYVVNNEGEYEEKIFAYSEYPQFYPTVNFK